MVVDQEQELIALGRAVRRLRRARRLSIALLASKAGMSARQLGRIERGHGNPRLDTLYALAKALKLRPGELVGEITDEDRAEG